MRTISKIVTQTATLQTNHQTPPSPSLVVSMQGSEYGRDSAVIVGRLAVANPHVLVVVTHNLQKNASFKFHIFDNIYIYIEHI